jgi:hypothetical protein
MVGLGPAIHVFPSFSFLAMPIQGVDGRSKPDHDGKEDVSIALPATSFRIHIRNGPFHDRIALRRRMENPFRIAALRGAFA